MKRLFVFLLGVMLSFTFLNAKVTVTKNSGNGSMASLDGTVWWDENLNGIQDEDAKGIAGIRVHLYKNGEDTGEMVLTEGEGEGKYNFSNLEPDANYTVKIDLPANYPDFTLQNQGDDDTLDSDIVNWPWRSESVYLQAGDCAELDAGLICKLCAQLHLEKYTNGVLVKEQSDIPRIKVGDKVTWKYVVYNDSTKITIDNIKVTDDKEGDINCPQSSLEPGESMECFKEGIAQEGLYSNKATVTGTSPDKNLTDEYPSNYYGVLAKIDIKKLTNGQETNSTSKPKLHVGDKVTWDYIVKNIGNVKLTNIKVVDDKEGAVSCPKSELDVNESMTCTKEGIVQAGEYENQATVTATSEGGDVDTSDTDKGGYTGVIGACLGDYMWLDSNLNGIQDANEPGVVGIKVDLYDENGNFLATTKTDSQGKYMFCGLKAGVYKVKFELPNTYLFTKRDQGSDSADSDVDDNGWSHTVTLEEDGKNLTIDAGIYCECDDSKVHPKRYKKLFLGSSLSSTLLLVLFLYITTFTVRRAKKSRR